VFYTFIATPAFKFSSKFIINLFWARGYLCLLMTGKRIIEPLFYKPDNYRTYSLTSEVAF